MKETFYFQHDYEPTSDPKIQAMIGKYGAVGYGLFWRIVEMLHSDEDHRLPKREYIFLALAQQMLTPVEQVKQFVQDCCDMFELFIQDELYFYSVRVIHNIENREKISEMRSKAGKISAEKRKNSTNDEHVLTGVQQNSTKESKEKEIKEKDIKEKESKVNTERVSAKKSTKKIDLDIPLIYPYESEKFMKVWNELMKCEKWRNKKNNALQISLHKLSKYPEAFAITLMLDAIENNWQGVVYDSTQKKYVDWQGKGRPEITDEQIANYLRKFGGSVWDVK